MFTYKVVEIREKMVGGKMSGEKLEKVLNEHARQGWQLTANLANGASGTSVGTTKPTEGATGWSDTWMIASKAKHPNCMYEWMNHIISPEANAAAAEWFGEAPANQKACAETASKDHCDTFHAEDDAAHLRSYWAGSATCSCVSSPPLISRSAIDSGFSCTPVSTSGPTYSSRPSPSWE